MQKNRTGILWLAFFIFVPTPLFSLPPTENAYGILVKFKNASKSTWKTRDQLHAKIGTQLKYRPKLSPFDFVLPKSEEQQHDLAGLTNLCQTYKANPTVADCEINATVDTRSDKAAETAGAPPVVDTCPLTATHGTPLLKEGTLSPFWAQEMVGADLVAFPRNAAKMGVGVRIALMDQGFGEAMMQQHKVIPSVMAPSASASNHGALSLGLISGPVPFTLQAPIELTHLFEVRSTVDYLKVLDTLEESKRGPIVLQISVGLGFGSGVARDALKRLSEKSILVAAAGNDWPAEMDRNEKEFPGILVGSLTPEGYPSATSAGPMLAISAPSDRYLQSTVDGKMAVPFGGTSGASAMVAGAIAAAKSLVPDLQTKEIKAILEQTAIPTPGSQNNPGFASMNTVKFLAVVDRIRSEGLAGKARDKAIATPSGRLYRFDKEAESELGRAMPVMSAMAPACEAKRMAFSQLRRAFFLQPTGPAREALAQALNQQGLSSNARFVENLDRETLGKHLAEEIVSTDPVIRVSAARTAGLMGNEGMETLLKFAENGTRAPASEAGTSMSEQAALKGIAAAMDPEMKKIFVSRLKTHRNSDVQKLAEEI